MRINQQYKCTICSKPVYVIAESSFSGPKEVRIDHATSLQIAIVKLLSLNGCLCMGCVEK